MFYSKAGDSFWHRFYSFRQYIATLEHKEADKQILRQRDTPNFGRPLLYVCFPYAIFFCAPSNGLKAHSLYGVFIELCSNAVPILQRLHLCKHTILINIFKMCHSLKLDSVFKSLILSHYIVFHWCVDKTKDLYMKYVLKKIAFCLSLAVVLPCRKLSLSAF